MRMNKAAKRIIIALMIPLVLLSACKKKDDEQSLPAPTPDKDELSFTADETAYGTPKPSGALAARDTVTYVFDGVLYGGFTYENTGNQPLVLTKADLSFELSTGERLEQYVPFYGVDDVVYPGETACAAIFLPIESGEAISLKVLGIEYEVSQASYYPLEVEDERLIKNYPAFSTLSGSLENKGDKEISLCFVYVMIYDESGKLAAVWYFPQNTMLKPGQSSAFVVHLKSLPIENLPERASDIRFRAFGLE